jgi:hypothetical protein
MTAFAWTITFTALTTWPILVKGALFIERVFTASRALATGATFATLSTFGLGTIRI